MNTELKQAIINFMFENKNDFQLINNTVKNFRQYIYTEKGNYCFGGEIVNIFIIEFEKLLKL